ncbi:sialidase-3-like isoform X2 [Neoarius graeffei]|uniref:sialidase-3-like isoform X2 n=1 Tax=Neoarius graeffei TaxID=443677 RepID=UPI00298D4633|nr:sialidase-3-like isoform X2 [Neoarius graeffei]
MENRTSGSDSHTLQADPPKTPLFRKELSGINYRIPALIYINDAQTFLVFAEKRTSPHDHDATLLFMRRGTRQNGSIQWSPVEELSTACLPEHRTMNPCPVYEKESKTVFLFFICVLGNTTENHQICTGNNKARLCYITSSDNGQNWSSTIDLTECVIGDEFKNWGTFAVGPGHGIQMKSGRLIIPAYFYENIHCSGRDEECYSYAFAFYSDDGKNWHFGKKMNWSSTIDLTECVIEDEIANWATFAVGPGHGIQMKSGRLIIPAYVYYMSRNDNDCPPHAMPQAFAFYSDDCGATWQFGERVGTESCEQGR